jgi:hypothetical protein
MKRYDLEELFLLVKSGETITFRSIFDFTGGIPDVFEFLGHCSKQSCTVVFDNENLTVKPDSNVTTNVMLTFYAHIAEHPEVIAEYLRYLTLLAESGEGRVPTPILKEVSHVS